jgi:hypothetical protein
MRTREKVEINGGNREKRMKEAEEDKFKKNSKP